MKYHFIVQYLLHAFESTSHLQNLKYIVKNKGSSVVEASSYQEPFLALGFSSCYMVKKFLMFHYRSFRSSNVFWTL